MTFWFQMNQFFIVFFGFYSKYSFLLYFLIIPAVAF